MNNKRRKLFKKLLRGFELGEARAKDVREKLGAPARTLDEDRVKILEYSGKALDAVLPGRGEDMPLARFGKVQFILYEDRLLNLSYAEPAPAVGRKKLQDVLGEPDEVPDEGEDESSEGDGLTDIFDVDLDQDPMLSFAAHYDARGNLEALSLCAEVEGAIDDSEEE